jgi:N-acetylmuramoyl-L-alanine amidase
MAEAKQDPEPTPDESQAKPASEAKDSAKTSATEKTAAARKAVAKPTDSDDDDDAEVALDPPAKVVKDAVGKRSVVKNNIAKDTVRKVSEVAGNGAAKGVRPDASSSDATTDGFSPDDSAASEKTSSKSKRGNKADDDVVAREARPAANGDRSLIRALGLKIGKIVIDPGHGGHDTGTIGPNGVREKDVVLDVSRRLGKMLRQQLGAEVIYTRSDDTFIPLETRTAIANRERADLFISVHANSSDDPDARGVETYYLNFTSSKDALEVAARENAVSQKSIYELQDLVKKIALKEKIDESREFASDVQSSLYSSLASKSSSLRNRGVKKAPFIVLIGANMPSILAEISFVSNPVDAKRLQTPEHRQQIAESLYRGVARYVNGLSGVKVASRISRDERN